MNKKVFNLSSGDACLYWVEPLKHLHRKVRLEARFHGCDQIFVLYCFYCLAFVIAVRRNSTLDSRVSCLYSVFKHFFLRATIRHSSINCKNTKTISTYSNLTDPSKYRTESNSAAKQPCWTRLPMLNLSLTLLGY